MPSIISAELRINGNLVAQGDVMIEGVVEGDIKCQSVTIGESAAITGSIEAETARVCGMIKGRITAKSVTLAPTARVIGDIVHDSIAIETGAYFEGQLRHRDTLSISGPAEHLGGGARADIEARPITLMPLKDPREPKEGREAKEARVRHAEGRGASKATTAH